MADTAGFSAADLIIAKRDGEVLSPEAIRWFVEGFTNGTVAAEQAAAMNMAIFFRGLDGAELSAWTEAMIDSGVRRDLSSVRRPLVDKHSTGGVGDKVSLILAPLMAACGAAMPQVAGRGLGHTGGTIDKLEAIPGWHRELDPAAMAAVLDDVGAVIVAASDDLAPADRVLYALRDVTGTVASIPLICSSIMSKKIAAGTTSLVLDIKVGRGAFMTTVEAARDLADTMIDIGERSGVATSALLTRMEVPLGRKVGNALEVAESVEVLRGGGPDDLIEVTVALAEVMCELGGIDADPGAVLASGAAEPVWDAMIRAQGGDPSAPLPTSEATVEITATRSGVVSHLDALDLGRACVRLGAGRALRDDVLDLGAGVEILAPVGSTVDAGDPVLRVHSAAERLGDARTLLEGAIEIGDAAVDRPPVVIERR